MPFFIVLSLYFYKILTAYLEITSLVQVLALQQLSLAKRLPVLHRRFKQHLQYLSFQKHLQALCLGKILPSRLIHSFNQALYLPLEVKTEQHSPKLALNLLLHRTLQLEDLLPSLPAILKHNIRFLNKPRE